MIFNSKCFGCIFNVSLQMRPKAARLFEFVAADDKNGVNRSKYLAIAPSF